MFDLAYENEAAIEAATIEKDKVWSKILNSDKKIEMFFLGLKLAEYIEILEFYSIMYGTHGV